MPVDLQAARFGLGSERATAWVPHDDWLDCKMACTAARPLTRSEHHFASPFHFGATASPGDRNERSCGVLVSAPRTKFDGRGDGRLLERIVSGSCERTDPAAQMMAEALGADKEPSPVSVRFRLDRWPCITLRTTFPEERHKHHHMLSCCTLDFGSCVPYPLPRQNAEIETLINVVRVVSTLAYLVRMRQQLIY